MLKMDYSQALSLYRTYKNKTKELQEEIEQDIEKMNINSFHAQIGSPLFFELMTVLSTILKEEELMKWNEVIVKERKEAEDEELIEKYRILLDEIKQAKRKQYKIEKHASYLSRKKRIKVNSTNKNPKMSLLFRQYLDQTPVFLSEDIIKMEKGIEQRELIEDFFDTYARIQNHMDALHAKLNDFLKYENEMRLLKTFYDTEEIIEKEGLKRFTASTVTKDIISKFIESKEEKMIQKRQKVSKIEHDIKKDCELKEDLSLYKKYSEKDDKGYIYIIREYKSDTYKVGRSRVIKRRSDQFRTKLPFIWEYVAILPVNNYVKIESELHLLFQHYRVEGEWFAFDAEKLKECYKKLKEYHKNFKDTK